MKNTSMINPSIVFFTSDTVINSKILCTLPHSTLSRNWDGSTSQHTMQYVIATDSKFLHILVDFPVVLANDSKPPIFTRDLWQGNVFELFIAWVDGSYTEIHLSPSGAWWLGYFVENRILKNEALDHARIDINSTSLHATRTTLCSIPQALYQPYKMTSDMVGSNVCACFVLNGQNHLSSTRLPGDLPDFHQPKHFATPLLIPVLVNSGNCN